MSHGIAEWVTAAPDARQTELRQAVHTILLAIAELRRGGLEVVMKGGILLAVEYAGDRYTKDVDFSTASSTAEIPPTEFVEKLNSALAQAANRLDYGMDCRVQSHELRPPGEDKTWPTLKMRVGYAKLTDKRQHAKLMGNGVAAPVDVDLSYNEVITGSETIDIGDGVEIEASTLADLVAEKFRAMIQQPVRKRYRRQDAYDLYCLLEAQGSRLAGLSDAVREALLRKSEGRGLVVDRESLCDPEVERRSKAEYPQLAAEITRKLPEFDDVYGKVRAYYEGMGWT